MHANANLVLFVRVEDCPCPLFYNRPSSSSRPGASILETVVPIFPPLLARLVLASLTPAAALEAGHHSVGVYAVQYGVKHLESHLGLLVLVKLVHGRRAGLVCPRTEQVGVVTTL